MQLALLAGRRVAVAWDDGHSELPGILLRVGEGREFGKPARLSASGAAASYP